MSFSFRSWWPSRGKYFAARPNYVPRVIELEERTLPSTFTVLNLHDSGPGSPCGPRLPRQTPTPGDRYGCVRRRVERHHQANQRRIAHHRQRDDQGSGAGPSDRQRQQRQPRLRNRDRPQCGHQWPDYQPRVRPGTGRRYSERREQPCASIVRGRTFPQPRSHGSCRHGGRGGRFPFAAWAAP